MITDGLFVRSIALYLSARLFDKLLDAFGLLLHCFSTHGAVDRGLSQLHTQAY